MRAAAFALFALLIGCATNAAAPSVTGAWTLVSVGDLPVRGQHMPSLTLDGHGHANGNSGCNSFGGQYAQSGDTLTFTHMISTMMACVGPNGEDGVMTLEQAFNSILHDPVSASVAGDQLTLTAIDGRTLHFQRGTAQ